ncbi:hypothetical protein [Aestuariivirga sp.]|uniref:hypothetical protein n=1 Tax=Aestuariivirga sp. TaxID=2650926 RepID=UPI0039E5907E
MTAVDHIEKLAFRSLRLADVPALREHLQFRALRQRYYREYWRRVARDIGGRTEELGAGFIRITNGGRSAIVRQGEMRLDDHLTLDMMGNKPLTYRLMMEQGCAVPQYAAFTFRDLKPALSLLETTGGPLVVKPASGTGGGNGVITGIRDTKALKAASFLASRFDTRLLAEKQIEGQSHRLLYLDGLLLDAIRRDPPSVTGDGRSNIRDLMRMETARRLEWEPFTALSPLRLDREARNTLDAQGLKPSTVLQARHKAIVKHAANQNAANENHVVTRDVHPATARLGRRMVNALGVRFAGVDIIARDISQPLGPANGVIGEINTTPGLHHHDLVASRSDGRMIGTVIIEQLMREAALTETSPMLHMVAG